VHGLPRCSTPDLSDLTRVPPSISCHKDELSAFRTFGLVAFCQPSISRSPFEDHAPSTDTISDSLTRCRSALSGWYSGSLNDFAPQKRRETSRSKDDWVSNRPPKQQLPTENKPCSRVRGLRGYSDPTRKAVCSATVSSNALIPFHPICTPMQTRRKDDNFVITVIAVRPSVRASRSANP